MFIRKKKNPGGAVSVRVTDKSNGRYRVLHTVGSSSGEAGAESPYQQGKERLSQHYGERDMFAGQDRRQEEKQIAEHLLSKIENILLNDTQLILNPVFELIEFNKTADRILKQLVVSRICQLRSKVAAVDYLKSYHDEDTERNKICRCSDKLYDRHKEKVQEISAGHTKKTAGRKNRSCFFTV